MSVGALTAGALRLACICLMVGLSTGCTGTTKTSEEVGVWGCWMCAGGRIKIETESTGELEDEHTE